MKSETAEARSDGRCCLSVALQIVFVSCGLYYFSSSSSSYSSSVHKTPSFEWRELGLAGGVVCVCVLAAELKSLPGAKRVCLCAWEEEARGDKNNKAFDVIGK